MPIQVQGYASGLAMEVDSSVHRAARFSLRPLHVDALGSYKAGSASGIMAAGLAGAAPIYSFRGPATGLALIRRVTFEAGVLGTAFTAGSGLFTLFAARGFSASDTGGGALTLTTNNAKLRTAFGTTGVQDIRCSATATLSAGTRTLDAAPLANLIVPFPATTVSTILVPLRSLLMAPPGEWPLVLAANEGFVIQATVPATGTWSFSVNVEWDEIAAANY